MSSHVFASVHDWTKYLRDSKGIKYTMVHAVAHAIAYSTYWWFDLEDELNVRPLVIFSGTFCPLSASPNTTRNRSCDQENQEGQKEQEPDIARQHTSTYWQKKHQETSRNIKKHQETSRNIKKHQETSRNIKKHQETQAKGLAPCCSLCLVSLRIWTASRTRPPASMASPARPSVDNGCRRLWRPGCQFSRC